jgi:hypothetical protein
MGRTWLVVWVVLGALAGSVACVGGGEPPAVPSWDRDVYPILRGSCSHCHGILAGPSTLPTSRFDICSSMPFNTAFNAEKVWIVTDSMGNPTVGGASTFAGVIALQTGPSAPPAIRMPPPPAAPLDEYQQTILQRWAMASGASCTKQNPNRKPTYTVVKAPALEMGKVTVTIETSDPDGDQAFGYVKLGSAPLQVIPGSVRQTFTFEGVQPTDTLTVKLFDGYDLGP